MAIKVLDLDTQDDELLDIQKEISLLSRCDSPFITRYRGSQLQGSKLWLILDYAGGGSVRGLLKSGNLSEQVISLICVQVLQALVYLHRQASIIHRDIKAGVSIALFCYDGIRLIRDIHSKHSTDSRWTSKTL